MLTKFSRNMGKYLVTILQLHAEHGPWEHLNYLSFYLNYIVSHILVILDKCLAKLA